MENQENTKKYNTHPRWLSSPVTIEQKDVYKEIEAKTGIDTQTVQDVFKAYADIVKNYHIDGVNVTLPYIGIFKIIKTYFIDTGYTKLLKQKYGTYHSPAFKKDYIVLFSPKLTIAPYFRLKIVDSLPNNEDAHNVKRMPFSDHHYAYNTQDESTEQKIMSENYYNEMLENDLDPDELNL